MACNCGSKRRQPTGYGTVTPPPAPQPQQRPATLQTTDGKTLTFGSSLEAHAERIRRGGGEVKPG